MVKRAIESVYGLWRGVLEDPPEELVLRMSLLLFLLHGSEDPAFTLVMRLISLPMLLSRKLTFNRWLWIALAAVSVGSTFDRWFQQDNHKFLTTYWALACCLAVWSRNPARTLALNGRLLIALAFSFAVFWKFFGGEFVSGRFFEHMFLVDARFAPLAHTLGGVPLDALARNHELMRLLRTFPSETMPIALASSDRIVVVSRVLAFATVLLEGGVAALFWLRFRIRNLDIHNWLLMAFCVTTYAMAPVIGFAYLLVTMGLAQCNLEHRDTRTGYLWTFIIVQFALLNIGGAVGVLAE